MKEGAERTACSAFRADIGQMVRRKEGRNVLTLVKFIDDLEPNASSKRSIAAPIIQRH